MAKRLLLADDSITIQKVVELVLTDEGFEIMSAANGEEALQSVSTFRPDIILADIEMPKVNGYQLCEKIKTNPLTKNIPVILLAGAFEPIDEELSKKVRADGFIVKPFESHDLIKKINASLSLAPAAEAMEVEAEEAVAVEAAAVGEEEDLWAMEGFSPEAVEGAEALEAEAEEQIEAPAVEEPSFEEAMLEEEEAPEEIAPEAEMEEEASAEEMPALEKKFRAPEVGMPSSEQITEAFGKAAYEKVSELLKGTELKQALISSLAPSINKAIETTIREIAPELIETHIRGVLKGVAESLRQDIEKVIWETVPDLAESIIKKEIEKIKSEI